MNRTDFTSEIDGALATRNLGSRHYSDIARSGNGNMLSDLAETELAGYQELDGLGEDFEELSASESKAMDTVPPGGIPFGGRLPISEFRSLKSHETPPFQAQPGNKWFRKRIPTQSRKPGGRRLVRNKWVQMNDDVRQRLAREGRMDGMGILGLDGVTGSLVAGVIGGTLLYLVFRKKR